MAGDYCKRAHLLCGVGVVGLLLSCLSTVVQGTVVDLNEATFNQTFLAVPAGTPTLQEFWASWCPACKQFAPEYEKIGKFFTEHPETKLLVSRIDCAHNTAICTEFKIKSYPSVTLSLDAHNYASRAHSDIAFYDMSKGRDAKNIIEWVGEKLSKTFTYEEPKEEVKDEEEEKHDAHAPAVVVPKKLPVWTMEDVEGATMELHKIIVTNPLLLEGPEKLEGLKDIWKLWAVAHPSVRCKTSAGALLSQLPQYWPARQSQANKEIEKTVICGEARFTEWQSCKGTKSDSRGYSCGLWLLLHTLSLRLTSDSEVPLMMKFLKSFNTHFFQCEVCQRHFAKVLDSGAAKSVRTRKDLVLWLWSVHNEVNSRLAEIEKRYGHSSTGDPAFPKLQFPTPEQCPICQKLDSASKPMYNSEEVFNYLIKTYGPGPSEQGIHLGELLLSGTAQESRRAGKLGSNIQSPATGSVTPYLLGGVLLAALLVYYFTTSSANSLRRKSLIR